LIIVLGDAHIYNNHIEQVDELLARDPEAYPLSTLELDKKPDIFSYTLEDMRVVNYRSFPAIKAPISV
jgi:thymidylate synthase